MSNYKDELSNDITKDTEHTFAIIPARPPQTILLVISAAPFVVADDDVDITGALDWAAILIIIAVNVHRGTINKKNDDAVS